jgi:glycosyltransferase involved in cell wall biosynthesis
VTSSSSSPGFAPAGRAPVDVAVLKSWNFDEWRARYGDGRWLPYRIDHLERHGLIVHWTDAVHETRWAESRSGGIVRSLEAATVPFAQAALMSRRVRRAPITLAMFESEANAVAAARRAWPRQPRGALAVVTCWLAHLLTSGGARRRAAYRWAYQSVDRLYYLSENQGPILSEQLRLPDDRLRYLPFGVDDEFFRPTGEPDGDYVLVVGRDRGRDWPTLLRAVDGIDMPVKICCRRRDLDGQVVPSGVEVLGYVDRDVYRHLLGRARVVAIAARPLVYPSGQSVLLEALAMGRTVVVTQTEALAGYVSDGKTALTVAPGDASALRERIVEAASDDDLRGRLGRHGRDAVERTFNARRMWEMVADDLLDL